METPAIECHGLTRTFSHRAAVSNLDFTVPTGSVFGFLGPNGAGKTTTVRMLLGILPPTSGMVRVLGHDPIREGEKVRAQCGVVLDQVGLYERLTARQNLEFAARIGHLPRSDWPARIDTALQRVELWSRRNDRVSGFSKGMRQKLGVARALLADPKLLVLDEPTAGLDPENIVLLRELLVSLAQEGGRTIFLCTHLLAEAQKICDRVGILQRGRLLATGAPSEIGRRRTPSVRLTLRGLSQSAAERLTLPLGATLTCLTEGEWRLSFHEAESVEAVVMALVQAGVGIRAVVPEEVSLEEAYLEVVGGNPNE